MNAADLTPVLQVDGLSLEFRTRGRAAEVLSDVSFDLRPGETLCLVGESGCGKSMTALAIMRLIPPLARIGAGHVRLRGADLAMHDDEAMRRVRGNNISMIFQEPMTALRSANRCASTRAFPNARRASAPSRCSSRWASRCPSGAWTTIRTSCLAACGSGS